MNGRGLLGENAAAKYLLKKDYKILARNFATRFGEIDIVASDNGFIVFCEVKARKPGALVSGLESVDYRKQQKIVKTANFYLLKHTTKLQPRFDVITLVGSDSDYKIETHIENAF